MEQALAAIHLSNPRRLPMEFSFGCHEQKVALGCRFPAELVTAVTTQLAAHYPSATLTRHHDEAVSPQAGTPRQTWSVELRLRPDLFPIRRYAQFDDALNRNASDPLTGLFAALTPDKHERMRSTIAITACPAKARRVRHCRKVVGRLARPFFRSHPALAHWYASAATCRRASIRALAVALRLLSNASGSSAGTPSLNTSSARAHEREEDIQAASDKLGRHLFEVRIHVTVAAPLEDAARAKQLLRQMTGAFGQFTIPRMATFHVSRVRRSDPRGRRSAGGFLLSSEELATLWHPATATVRAPAMQVTESRELEPPVTLPLVRNEPAIAQIGRIAFRGRQDTFGIQPEDRRRHLAIIGKTGMGKTTLLQRLIISDIVAGRGLAVIDPHGDLADSILDCIPPRRTNEVIVFDAGDRDYPFSFNPLSCPDMNQRPLVASGVVSSFKKLYGDSWGPRLEHILRNGLLALLEDPSTSLLSLQRLLGDGSYRKGIVDRLGDPVVRAFWQHEFASWKPQYQVEAVAPIQNKLGQFLAHPILRAILGQACSRLDLRLVMDEGQVLVANLSKGKIGEDGSTLLGSLLVTSLQLAAMSRADQPEADRRDFFLYVDEFQHFATDSFATILSEARKYRLNLVLANQYLAQMEESTAAALFGNVGSLLAFQVGADDAETLAAQLGEDLTARDLLSLPRFRAYARLLIDGLPSRPFSLETLPPPKPPRQGARGQVARRASRHRYNRPARHVAAEIAAALSH